MPNLPAPPPSADDPVQAAYEAAYVRLQEHAAGCRVCLGLAPSKAPCEEGDSLSEELRAARRQAREAAPVPICRACGEPIAPEDAVHLGDEETDTGPWRAVWAHRAHVDAVDLMPPGLAEVMLRLWAAGS